MSGPWIEARFHSLASPTGDILQNLSFDLQRAEVLLLRGPNGTGKSTLIKQIFGLIGKPQNPKRTLNVFGTPSVRFMSQSLNREFFLPLTLGDVAKMGLTKGARPLNFFEHLLPASLWNRAWNVASGGEKQRALLVQALRQPSDIYLLDEPFNHLDTESVDFVASMIAEFATIQKASFVVATHLSPVALKDTFTKGLNFVGTREVFEK